MKYFDVILFGFIVLWIGIGSIWTILKGDDK